MGYAYYEIDGRQRGYGFRCKCHARGCSNRIDRGLAYLCYNCTWYFCGNHLTVAGEEGYIEASCFAGDSPQTCFRCARQLERDARRAKRQARKQVQTIDALEAAAAPFLRAPDPIPGPSTSTLGYYTIPIGHSGDYLLVRPDA